ncbi:hypothetical protein ABKN59_002473 [Abortiporus biennis]
MRPPLRCFWYDEDKNPRLNKRGTLGCPYKEGKCYFVHPNDPGWDAAKSSTTIPNQPQGRTPSPVPNRRPLFSGRQEQDSRIASTPPPPPPPPSGLLSRAWDKERERDMRDISPRRESRPRYPERREDSPPYIPPPVARGPPIDRRRYARTPPPLSPPRDRARMPPLPPPRKIPPPAHGTTHDSRMEPSSSRLPSNNEQTLTEGVQLSWEERIKLLAESVITFNEHIQLNKDVENYSRLTRSEFFESLSSSDQQVLLSKFDSVKVDSAKKKEALEKLIERLAKGDFWPLKGVDDDTTNGEEKKKEEVEKSIEGLKRNVEDLYELVKFARGDKQKQEEGEVEEGPVRKRRRLSAGEIDEDGRSQQTTTSLPQPQLQPQPELQPSSSSNTNLLLNRKGKLQKIRDKLESFDVRLSDLENQLVDRDAELTEVIDSKFEEIRSTIPQAQGQRPDYESKLESLERDVSSSSHDITQLAVEIAELMKQESNASKEVKRLQTENDTLRFKIDKLEELQRETTKAIKQNKAETAALNAALTAYISQPPQPSITPSPQPISSTPDTLNTVNFPPLSDLISHLRPDVQTLVRQDVQPMLSELRKNIDGMLKNHSADLSKTILTKLGLTLQSLEAFTRWIEGLKQRGVNINGIIQSSNTVIGVGPQSGTSLPPAPPSVSVTPSVPHTPPNNPSSNDQNIPPPQVLPQTNSQPSTLDGN